MPCFLICISDYFGREIKSIDGLIWSRDSEWFPPSAFFKPPKLYYNHPNKYY